MKKLNVKTTYSRAAGTILAMNKILRTIFLIGAIIFLIVAISGEGACIIGTGICLLFVLINWFNNAILSAITGISKASEYYIAVIEDEYSINEISTDEKGEKSIDVNSQKNSKGTKTLPYKVGDFVYCESKGIIAVVLSIKGNNISCGVENENGEMVEIGIFKTEDISVLNN